VISPRALTTADLALGEALGQMTPTLRTRTVSHVSIRLSVVILTPAPFRRLSTGRCRG
jgi:hypothetical protein